MKKNCIFAVLTMIALLIACFSACSSQESSQADYTIIRDNGQCFIQFDDITSYQVDSQEIANVTFPTMKEFKDAVTTGKLTDHQKKIIATAFAKNSDGTIKSCDFDKLYEPKFPDNGTVSGVLWNGEAYGFELALSDSVFGWLHYLPQEAFQERYKTDYTDLFSRNTITVTKTVDLEDGKTATYYKTQTGELMNIRYTLSSGDTSVTVDKTFWLKMDNPELAVSAEVPNGIEMYCTSPDGYYYISLYGFTKDPTDNWLSALGITPYADNALDKA